MKTLKMSKLNFTCTNKKTDDFESNENAASIMKRITNVVLNLINLFNSRFYFDC